MPLEDTKPAPHLMGSIPNNPSTEVVKKFEGLLYYRRRTDATEGQIAKLLEFGSPTAMYGRFKREGFPVCEACGQIPAKERHCENNETPKKRRARRPRRSDGVLFELSPAGNATELLLGALKKLGDDARDLEKREEFFQDGRFVMQRNVALTWIHRRDMLPDQAWREICEWHGKDPTKTEVVEEAIERKVPGGASRTPPAPLPALIACIRALGRTA